MLRQGIRHIRRNIFFIIALLMSFLYEHTYSLDASPASINYYAIKVGKKTVYDSRLKHLRFPKAFKDSGYAVKNQEKIEIIASSVAPEKGKKSYVQIAFYDNIKKEKTAKWVGTKWMEKSAKFTHQVNQDQQSKYFLITIGASDKDQYGNETDKLVDEEIQLRFYIDKNKKRNNRVYSYMKR
jgi:hypothetical protein